jgi:hypothetical protein
VVDVAGGKIKSVSIFWYAHCSSGDRFDFGGPITTVASRPAIIADGQNVLVGARVAKSGRFKGRGLGSVDLGGSSGALSERVQGKLAANAAFGSFRAQIDMVDKRTGKHVDSCDTGTISWKAPVPQSLYYGGSSTQGEPVVLQLSRDRRHVNLFRIAWFAQCSSESSLDYGDALAYFDMSRGGSFGDTFTQTYPDDSGGQAEYAYVLNGKVGRRSASGSFHVVATFTDSSGAVTDTCTSPAIQWSVQQ